MNQSLDWNLGVLSISLSQKYRLIAEGGTPSLQGSQGCFCRTVLLYILATCWDMALCVSALTVPTLWCPVEESASRQAGRELQCAPADPTAERSQAGMLSALGTETSVALVEAAPLCPDCPRGLRGAELPLHPGRSSAPVGSGKHALQRGLY